MPIYEYRCTECRHEFEELVRSNTQKVVCTKCHSGKVERKLSTFAALVARPSSCAARDECQKSSSCCSGEACSHHHGD